MVLLETERLQLRPPRPEDAAALTSIYGDAAVMRYIGSGNPLRPDQTAEAVLAMIRRWESDGFGLFSVERREDGRLLGEIGLLAWDPGTWRPGSKAEIGAHAEIEIGWTLGRDHWGSGYATEGASAVRDWAVAERRLERLISLIQPGNAASIRVAEKLGARHEQDIVTGGGQLAHVYALGPATSSA